MAMKSYTLYISEYHKYTIQMKERVKRIYTHLFQTAKVQKKWKEDKVRFREYPLRYVWVVKQFKKKKKKEVINTEVRIMLPEEGW